MAISPVSSVSPASASLSMEDLLRVMLTQLTYQDPMKPVDSTEFITQIAQFSALDASRQLNDNMEQLLQMQSLTQSVGLLGRTVDAQLVSGAVTGEVKSLSLLNGEPQLTLHLSNGQVVAGVTIGQIQSVR
jgi:flagellar basal-body rod modification protein FlgD